LVKRVFDALLYVEAQVGFDEFRDFFAVDAVTITNREKMSASIFSQMWKDQVRILVDLVRVLGTEARLGRERKLCDAVVKLLRVVAGLRFCSGHFSVDRGSDITLP